MFAIILTGPPASGKTTVANILSRKYGLCSFDMDIFRHALQLTELDIPTYIHVVNAIILLVERFCVPREKSVVIYGVFYRNLLKYLEDRLKWLGYDVFTFKLDVPLEELLRRNREREQWKQLPEDRIRMIYNNFQSLDLQAIDGTRAPEEVAMEIMRRARDVGT